MKRFVVICALTVVWVGGCDSQTATDPQAQYLQTYASRMKSDISLLNQDATQFAFDMRIFNQRWEQFLKSLSNEQLVAMGNYEEAVAIGTIIDRTLARRALVKSFSQEQITQIYEFHSEAERLKDQMQQLELQAQNLTRERYELLEYGQQMLARKQQWAEQYRQTVTNPQ